MANWFDRAFGAAVADVRQKLVEEAWFGRVAAPRPENFGRIAADDRPPGERLGWDVRQPTDREQKQPTQGIDIDR